MRKIFVAFAATVVIASAVALIADATPGQAQTPIVYPWCAHYGGSKGGGAASCGSLTYEQCMATLSGQQGFCDRNPFYEGPAIPAPSVRERRNRR